MSNFSAAELASYCETTKDAYNVVTHLFAYIMDYVDMRTAGDDQRIEIIVKFDLITWQMQCLGFLFI